MHTFVVSKNTFSYIGFFYIVLDFALLLLQNAETVSLLLKFLQNLQVTPVPESLSQQNYSLKTCNITKTETPAQMFFCEFCTIFKNIYLAEYLRTITSENGSIKQGTKYIRL